jgi:hypothetical protein
MKHEFRPIPVLTLIFSLVFTSFADVTIKQRVTMSGQKFESTRRIKGSRERTEQKMEVADPSMSAFMPQIATITQCDLKRKIQVNDGKKLYYMEPFETSDTQVLPGRPAQPAPATGPTRRGGTMTMSYNVRDTGERKMMFGLQARHIISTQEMETSPDSCNGPTKMKTEYDGWYVDFAADFSCSTNSAPAMPGGRMPKPDCIDHVVTRGTGTAPKGMMLEGKMTMYGPDGSVQMSQMTETLELNRNPLDAGLFDIPLGYNLAHSSQDLYAVTLPSYGSGGGEGMPTVNTGVVPPRMAAKTVSLNIMMAPGTSDQSEIDSYVRTKLAEHGMRIVSDNADYAVSIQVNQIKESTSSKIGGMFGKMTGTTNNVGKVDIDMSLSVTGKSTGSAKVKSKFDGPLSSAVRAALDQAMEQLMSGIGQ